MSWRRCRLQTATAKQKKEKTLEQKLLWPSLCLCSLRPGLRWIQKCSGEYEQLELASFALVLILCSLHVKNQVSYTLCLLFAFVHGRSQPMRANWRRGTGRGIKVLPENVPLKYRDYEKAFAGQPGPATSKFLWGQMRCTQSYADPPPAATRQLNHVYLMSSASFKLLFLAVSCIPSCENTISYSILSLKWFPEFNQLVFRFFLRSSWFGQIGFVKNTRRIQDENPLMFGSLCTELQNLFQEWHYLNKNFA